MSASGATALARPAIVLLAVLAAGAAALAAAAGTAFFAAAAGAAALPAAAGAAAFAGAAGAGALADTGAGRFSAVSISTGPSSPREKPLTVETLRKVLREELPRGTKSMSVKHR
jgi:hypothetical protein